MTEGSAYDDSPETFPMIPPTPELLHLNKFGFVCLLNIPPQIQLHRCREWFSSSSNKLKIVQKNLFIMNQLGFYIRYFEWNQNGEP
ncbi:MAG: hypothetical protein D6732_06185 [Methanobacteriota archaeon]|nr:MAG: hypothetical protein D6732_06185 [Euryarchaeota archaeon]